MSATPDRPLVITSVFGTRPEAVKLLPLLRQLAHETQVTSRVVLTGQHREMVDQILRPFAITPEADLGIMRPRQSLNDIVARAMPALDQLLERERPDMVVVQGDTTSAFCAALAAFHRRIPVAHLEAGLRTYDRFHPYPEEVNRRMISAVADLHLAPTARAAAALKAEGVPDRAVVVTGNTVIDALLMALAAPGAEPEIEGAEDPLLLVTLHRREAWDSPGAAGASVLDGILEAIATVARRHPELTVVYPVHLNPRVQEPAADRLGGLPNVKLVPPQPYLAFVKLMAKARVILTDSGGIQEEAPSLGIPVLVVRQTTERPEGLASGATKLVGTDPGAVEASLEAALAAPHVRPAVLPAPSPFGDGQAAARTVQAILHFLGRGGAPAPFSSPEQDQS
jgi:UDP-N-acetylglucosamine 2-epimerase (non-hydrolysing)